MDRNIIFEGLHCGDFLTLAQVCAFSLSDASRRLSFLLSAESLIVACSAASALQPCAQTISETHSRYSGDSQTGVFSIFLIFLKMSFKAIADLCVVFID